MRKCQCCGLVKEYTDFWTSNRSKSGWSAFCKDCKVIPNPENTKLYKGLPLFKFSDHWELYSNSKVYKENGQEFIVPHSRFIVRLRLDDLNWMDVEGSNYYQRDS